jgi:tRNA(Glu) U13 pseudouridine synthase TruD
VCVFSAIPSATRKLYLHAYQSYVWNVVATRRLVELGAQAPVVGPCRALC